MTPLEPCWPGAVALCLCRQCAAQGRGAVKPAASPGFSALAYWAEWASLCRCRASWCCSVGCGWGGRLGLAPVSSVQCPSCVSSGGSRGGGAPETLPGARRQASVPTNHTAPSLPQLVVHSVRAAGSVLVQRRSGTKCRPASPQSGPVGPSPVAAGFCDRRCAVSGATTGATSTYLGHDAAAGGQSYSPQVESS